MGPNSGIAAVIMMICVIGGRVIPSFTRNWLVQQESDRLPVPPMQRFDKVVLLVTVMALVAWIAAPDHTLTGVALLIIGVLHSLRLVRWQGVQSFMEPLLWILHVGYAFVPLGAVLAGAAVLWPDVVPTIAAQHLWMAGACGVMTRATLGHTGQSLHAGTGTVAIYLSLIGSILARITASVWVGSAMTFYTISGVLWIGAFLSFALVYGPHLMKPKPARA